jgi:hypothetical protein
MIAIGDSIAIGRFSGDRTVASGDSIAIGTIQRRSDGGLWRVDGDWMIAIG